MLKFPIYIQPDSMDCGPTCLKMVAKFYGKNLPLQLLRDKTQVGKDGVNLLGISEAAESIGLRTHAVKLSYHSLIEEAALPVILHWGQAHFVVLYHINKKNLLIADPAKGSIRISKEEFKRFWISDKQDTMEEGVALLLEPSPIFFSRQHDEDYDEKPGFKLNSVFNYILPYKKLILQLFIGLAIGSLLQLSLPFLTQSVVDTGINNGNIHFVYIVLLAQLALFAGRMVIEFIRGWILLHISARINLSILIDFLIKLMKLPLNFFDSKHTGDILQRMNDHRRIEKFLTDSSLNVLFSFINLLIFSAVLAVYNTSIFAVFIASALLYSAWAILFLKKRKGIDYKKFNLSAREQSLTIQLIQGMQEIRLHGAEKQMRWSWERLQARLFSLNIKSLSLNQWQQAGAFFINEGKNILITFLSAKAVIDGQMTLGAMLAVQYIIGQLNSPIERLLLFLQSLQDAKISMDRLNEIHSMEDEEPEQKHLLQTLPLHLQKQIIGGRDQNPFDSEDAVRLQRSEEVFINNKLSTAVVDSICFKNVSFTYTGAGNTPVLSDINLSIPIGKTTAIVGASGSGKTTLLKLLLKFYVPQKGEIRLGNTPLESVSHKAWRKHCGVVMQESFIFSDTIAKNIAVGEYSIDKEKLVYAAQLANIHDFIETIPLQYNSRIGFGGVGISMGQKQRILLARAIYRNPDFLLLDEATNSLDANNESAIVENLQSFFSGKTVIIVAHRLSTVRNADQIIVLEKGSIIEKGTHQELVNHDGRYYQLIKNQLELGT